MSQLYGVTVNTRIAGAADGVFKNDLNWGTIGQQPNEIRRISKIAIWGGKVIDSVRITYETSSGPLPPVIHGGLAGDEKKVINLQTNQTITAVYGRRLNDGDPGEYGNKCIVQISFVIVTTKDNNEEPGCEVRGHSAEYLKKSTTPFQFTWPLVGAISYTMTPTCQKYGYLQGIGFTELFSQAGGTL